MKLKQNLINLIEQNRTSKFAVYLSEEQLNNWAWENNCCDDLNGSYSLGLIKYLLSGIYEVDLIKKIEKFKIKFIKYENALYTLEKRIEFSSIKNIDITIDLIIEITNFVPARSAPSCSNPDSPAFSDSGDDADLEYNLFCKNQYGHKQELPDFCKPIIEDEDLYDEILEECNKKHEQDYFEDEYFEGSE